MSKRVADTYLTDDNWDKDEDKSEEAGVFVTASEEILKQRPIIKAKRRCAADATTSSLESGAGNAFHGFSGFTFTGPTSTQHANTTLEALNRTFFDSVNERLGEDASCDLSRLATDYCTQAKQLNSAAAAAANGVNATSTLPLGLLFGKSPNTWDCPICLINNKTSDSACVACLAPRPSSSAAVAASVAAEPTVTSSDPCKPSLAELFRKSEGEWDCSECFVRNKAGSERCPSCETKRPATMATASTSTQPMVTLESTSSSNVVGSTSAAASSFTFGSGGGFSFKPATAATFSGSGSGVAAAVAPFFQFGSANNVSSSSPADQGFGFKLPVASTITSAAPGFSFKLPDSTAGTTGSFGSGFTFGLSTASSVQPSTGFSFKPVEASSSEATGGGDENAEEDVPPKAETIEHVEEDAFYNVRCKLFYNKDDSWKDRGVGNLFLKPCDATTQLLIRAGTSLGNILLNVLVTSSMPISRQGTNNVTVVCVPYPALDGNEKNKNKNSPVCMLIRVKTSDMADELYRQLTECKQKEKSA